MKYRKNIGNYGETIGSQLLVEKGYKIVARNFKCKIGEIDIIALKDNVLHFIEVKTRTNNIYGSPAESVTREKQRRIKNTANYYLLINKFNVSISFDVMEIYINLNINCF